VASFHVPAAQGYVHLQSAGQQAVVEIRLLCVQCSAASDLMPWCCAHLCVPPRVVPPATASGTTTPPPWSCWVRV
jgi:hypothetical protein